MAKKTDALAASLLLLVASFYWLPEHIAPAIGWSLSALRYVASSLEATFLWATLSVITVQAGKANQLLPPMVWGMAESALKAHCRLKLPMDQAPNLGGQNLCAAVYGPQAEWASAALAMLAVAGVIILRTSGEQHGAKGN